MQQIRYHGVSICNIGNSTSYPQTPYGFPFTAYVFFYPRLRKVLSPSPSFIKTIPAGHFDEI